MELVALSLETIERFQFCTHHGGGGPNGGVSGGPVSSSAGADVTVDVGVEDFPQPITKTATAKANTIEDDMRLIKYTPLLMTEAIVRINKNRTQNIKRLP